MFISVEYRIILVTEEAEETKEALKMYLWKTEQEYKIIFYKNILIFFIKKRI